MTRMRAKRLPAALVLAWLALASGPGCSTTPEQRYEVLTFFFDGVPPPASMLEEVPVEEPLIDVVEEPLQRPRQPAVVYTMHDPYGAKDCDECHESKFSNNLTSEGEELCFGCHDEEDFGGEVLHGPRAAGECTACHNPHKSPYSFLLKEEGSALCEDCHDSTTFARLEAHRAEEGDDCVSCHNPHASDREYMLEEDFEVDEL
jgi:predicted CXXCH cytochrome family protein